MSVSIEVQKLMKKFSKCGIIQLKSNFHKQKMRMVVQIVFE